MPKLIDQHFKVEHGGATFETKGLTALVDSSGKNFSIELDDRLAEIARKIHGNCTLGTSHGKLRVCGKSIQDCQKFIRACIDEYLACEVRVEKVICYKLTTRLTFWRNADGTLRPNGAGATDGGWENTFTKNVNATHPTDSFSLGLAAKVFIKTSYHRSTGVTAKYEEVKPGHYPETPEEMLNSFAALHFKPEVCDEMPYSDEAAMFFVNSLLGMCRVADQFHQLFGNKERLQNAIAAGGAPLLGNG